MKKAFIQLTPTTTLSFNYSTLAQKRAIYKEETGLEYVPTDDELSDESMLSSCADLINMTPAEADAYIETVNSVPELKSIVKKMLPLLIVISNHIFPVDSR